MQPKTEAGKAPAARVALDTKTAPSQERAKATFDTILAVTGELLGEVGIERLSTNVICARAGITPPALYRYFPNKYAILREMARRLLAAEDAIVIDWLAKGPATTPTTLDQDIERNAALLRQVRKVVRGEPGGVWILRALRAVPVLREVRDESLATVANAVFETLHARHPHVDPQRLRAATLLSTTVNTAANEMIVDHPELDGPITAEVSRMVALYYRDLLRPPAKE